MGITIVFTNLEKVSTTTKRRKKQSQNILRENVIIKRINTYAEKRVKYSKRTKIELLAIQAGFNLTYADFILVSIFSSIIIGTFITIISDNILLGILFYFIGYMLPKQVFTMMKNRRIEKMEKQIGPFMEMITKRYMNTKDFARALELTTNEFLGEEPLYKELRRAVMDVKVGTPIGDAVDAMAMRTGNKYMMRLADYYKISAEVGTEEIRQGLLNQAFIQFEENRKAKSSMKKELSEPVREAYIMLGSIPGFILYESATSPGYIHFMTRTNLGHIGTAITTAVFMGALWFVNTKIGAPIE
jgi:Flp pilus assembly protein TadB